MSLKYDPAGDGICLSLFNGYSIVLISFSVNMSSSFKDEMSFFIVSMSFILSKPSFLIKYSNASLNSIKNPGVFNNSINFGITYVFAI